jgi:hypothetical protein
MSGIDDKEENMINGSCKRKVVKSELLPISSCVCYWGSVSLHCIYYPQTGGVRYRIISNQEEVLQTNYLEVAIIKYNELTD